MFALPSTEYEFSPFAGIVGNHSTVTNSTGIFGQTSTFTLLPEQTALYEDAGIVPFHTVIIIVWQDYSDNGLQDYGEPFLPGIEVALVWRAGNNGQGNTTYGYTDSNGQITFKHLLYGNYSVNVFLPNSSWVFSPTVTGINDVMSVGGLNGSTFAIFLGPTPSNFTFTTGMLFVDNLIYQSPANADSCLNATFGPNLAIGEIVNLYPKVGLVESTPPSVLRLSVSGLMQIINTTWIIGSR